MSRPRIATYRVQLTPEKGFEQVIADVERVRRLGASHLYLSPVTEAVPGSTHGYDVVDQRRVRAELGGVDGLWRLLDAADAARLGVIVDHVPNHVSVARPELNEPWWKTLRDGPTSPAARWFDIDWAAWRRRVLLPVLGEPLDVLVAQGAFTVDTRGTSPALRLGEQRWPLAQGTEHLPLDELLDTQHYRLTHWRDPDRNVRRFFTIDELVAVCVEHRDVAEIVDTVPRMLVDHAAFDGLRIDHVDGLADPAGYLRGVRELIGSDRWLLVEKILAAGETLPDDWPVDGTTGYEHIRVLEHALVNRGGVDALTSGWQRATGDARSFADWEDAARREVLAGGLAPDVERTVAAAVEAGVDGERHAAIVELSVHLARYRTYLPDDTPGRWALDAALAAAVKSRPDLATELDALTSALTSDERTSGRDALRTRWQQLTGPATAKGVEDRAFFRYVAVPSLCEVGGDPSGDGDGDAPGNGGAAIESLHDHHLTTAIRWPSTLLSGTTHDTKRSEDVRARGIAITEHACDVLDSYHQWTSASNVAHDVDASTSWLAFQTVLCAAPISAERLTAFLLKSGREADLHTSWADPGERYESAIASVAAELIDAVDGGGHLAGLGDVIAARGRAWSLAMLAVRCTAPGVPDVYQGTEAYRFLLVDPDNRVEPDRDELERIVELAGTLDLAAAIVLTGAEPARAVVLSRLLSLRRRHPDAFGPGSGYEPLPVEGDGDGRTIAFARTAPSGTAHVVVIAGATRAASDDGAAGAHVALPVGEWRHVLVDDDQIVRDQFELDAAVPATVLTPT